MFFIQPRNEGQELNYIETLHSTDVGVAIERAKLMQKTLARILVQGSITVDILDSDGDQIETVMHNGIVFDD